VDAAELKTLLKQRAAALGFDACVVADADAVPETARHLGVFLAEGRQGDMDWLARDPDRRSSPQGLWSEVKSVVVLGTNYAPEDDPLVRLARRDRAVISVYARNKDYHDVLKKRLKTLGRWFHGVSGAELKVFVDTAPVMEKPLGQRAGLGWQGKHTNLVSRAFGSWLFLAEIYTAIRLPPDVPERDHCGACRRCLDICPTAAFPEPYQLDARRCLSYLSIEHKGPIPAEFRVAMGNRIYGCDDCLAVCPWNKFAVAAKEAAFLPRDELTAPLLADLVQLDDAGFRAFFAGSPIKRIGRDRFVRNVLIALGNSGDAGQVGGVARLLDDPSPLVRGMAVWALRRLDPALLAGMAERRAAEEDPAVQAEWDRPDG
jgi:epoxyqueuosine reductase